MNVSPQKQQKLQLSACHKAQSNGREWNWLEYESNLKANDALQLNLLLLIWNLGAALYRLPHTLDHEVYMHKFFVDYMEPRWTKKKKVTSLRWKLKYATCFLFYVKI